MCGIFIHHALCYYSVMSYIFVGLGNPGEEYVNTRHNVGRMLLEQLAKKNDASDWKEDMKLKALTAKVKLGKASVQLVLPETFMNNSGNAVKPLVKSIKAAEQLVVVHDDLDLPLGRMKMSFDKSSGGHRGVESIIKAVKTQKFIRIRVGIAPVTPSGKIKKPQGEEAVGDFIIGPLKEKELDALKPVFKQAIAGLELLVTEGLGRAMSEANQG